MLLEFRVQNHRSLRDEQALSLEPSEHDSARETSPGGALTAIAIYGANASGKSNLLAAFAFMKHAVSLSHRLWDPEEGIPRDPFAWGASPPSLYEVSFKQDGVRYLYGFVADDQRFLEEWLFAWPRGRRQTWFTRDGDEFSFGDHLKGENRIVQQVTRPNALFLSAAVQNRHEQLAPVYHWFRRVTAINVPSHRGSRRIGGPPRDYWLRSLVMDRAGAREIGLFDEDEDVDARIDMLRQLVRIADVGITDLKVVQSNEEDDSLRPRRRSRIFLKHEHPDCDAWLPLEEESHGTRTLLGLAHPILRTLQRGGVLVVDELEASLHPLLAAYIVKQFSDPAMNPAGGQLLFTTHDTNLLGTTLGSPALSRDQVWLTEKNREGATCVYPLSDYKPRKAENLERGYLQGRYGAIPFLGELARPQD